MAGSPYIFGFLIVFQVLLVTSDQGDGEEAALETEVVLFQGLILFLLVQRGLGSLSWI